MTFEHTVMCTALARGVSLRRTGGKPMMVLGWHAGAEEQSLSQQGFHTHETWKSCARLNFATGCPSLFVFISVFLTPSACRRQLLGGTLAVSSARILA